MQNPKQTKRGRKNKVATEQRYNKVQRKKGKVQIKMQNAKLKIQRHIPEGTGN